MNSQRSQIKQLDGGRVKRIFALMQANYGSRWVQQTGTGDALKLAHQVWAEKLAGLTDEQIKRGFESLPDDFPPTPKKFRKICEGKEQTHHTTAYKRNFTEEKRIARTHRIELKTDRKKGRDALDYIKKLTGVSA